MNDKRQFRTIRWKCESCDWIGDDSEILRASSPFGAEDMIYGCPNCGDVDGIVNAWTNLDVIEMQHVDGLFHMDTEGHAVSI